MELPQGAVSVQHTPGDSLEAPFAAASPKVDKKTLCSLHTGCLVVAAQPHEVSHYEGACVSAEGLQKLGLRLSMG